MAEVVLFPAISMTSPADKPSFCMVFWSIRAIPLPTSRWRASPTLSCVSLIGVLSFWLVFSYGRGWFYYLSLDLEESSFRGLCGNNFCFCVCAHA